MEEEYFGWITWGCAWALRRTIFSRYLFQRCCGIPTGALETEGSSADDRAASAET